VTKGYLSKVENDRATASVAVLVRLCDALSVPMGSLFDDVPPGDVVRADAYPPIAFGGESQVEYLLTPPGEQRLQVIRGEIASGGGSGDESYELPADVGFVLVLSGSLSVTVDDRTVRLGDGDAFTFPPHRRHSFRAEARSTVLWVLTPSLPSRHESTGNEKAP
jgi:quercetin dioxygenase-like cupin family protein